jgi:hypothetical protein
MNRMRLRAAETRDAQGASHLVNSAFRPQRFFIDEDRTNPDKVRGLVGTGKSRLLEDSGVARRLPLPPAAR